jgi:hypothetical protein
MLLWGLQAEYNSSPVGIAEGHCRHRTAADTVWHWQWHWHWHWNWHWQWQWQ